MKKLEKFGYLRRERVFENGKIKDWVYYIYDEPCNGTTPDSGNVENPDFFDSQDTDLSDMENQDAENQHQEETHLEKPHDYIITKEEKSKKEESCDQVSIDQSPSHRETAVEKSSEDGNIEGYNRENETYTEEGNSNIE